MATEVPIRVTLEGGPVVTAKVASLTETFTGAFSRIGQAAFVFNQIVEAVQHVVGGLKAATLHAFELADRAGEMSAALGVTTEQLAALNAAFATVGISGGTMEMLLGRLSREAFTAANDAGSTAAKTFRALGVAVHDANGSIKDGATLLTDVAKGMAGLPVHEAKARAAVDLFGRGAARLLPLLSDLAENGLRPMQEEARKLGLAFDTHTVAAASRVEGGFIRLGMVWDGLLVSFGTPFLGVLGKISNSLATLGVNLLGAAKRIGLVEGASRGLVTGLEKLESFLTALNTSFKSSATEAKKTFDVIPAAHAQMLTQVGRNTPLFQGLMAAQMESMGVFGSAGIAAASGVNVAHGVMTSNIGARLPTFAEMMAAHGRVVTVFGRENVTAIDEVKTSWDFSKVAQRLQDALGDVGKAWATANGDLRAFVLNLAKTWGYGDEVADMLESLDELMTILSGTVADLDFDQLIKDLTTVAGWLAEVLRVTILLVQWLGSVPGTALGEGFGAVAAQATVNEQAARYRLPPIVTQERVNALLQGAGPGGPLVSQIPGGQYIRAPGSSSLIYAGSSVGFQGDIINVAGDFSGDEDQVRRFAATWRKAKRRGAV